MTVFKDLDFDAEIFASLISFADIDEPFEHNTAAQLEAY
jgi:hypothetical protein